MFGISLSPNLLGYCFLKSKFVLMNSFIKDLINKLKNLQNTRQSKLLNIYFLLKIKIRDIEMTLGKLIGFCEHFSHV